MPEVTPGQSPALPKWVARRGEARRGEIDLGITKRLGGREDLTAVGRFVGKARYSSPENELAELLRPFRGIEDALQG